MRTHLTTYDDVIRALGGVPKVAKLTDRSTQAVWNWRDRGYFPAALHQPMLEMLADPSICKPPCTAEHRLWRQEERVKLRQRNAA